MPGNGALDLTIRIMGKVDPSLAKSISSVTRQAGSISNVIGNIGKAGLAMTGALAGASAAVITSTTRAAQTFEGQMADVAKYVEGITDATGHIDVSKYNEMADAILRLSTQIPYTAEELTKLAAAAGESGYDFDSIVHIDETTGEITGFLKDVAMAGSALDISADQAGDWAAKWEVALNMSHGQVMDLFNQINYLAANTATSAEEIAQVVGRTGSVGNIAGMDPMYTAALADALLSMGVDTARAATSIKNIYTNLSLGASATTRMQKGWERIGMTAEGVAASMQANGPETMKEVFEAIGNLPDDQRLATITDIFGRWPLESAAKVAENMQAFQDAIDMVEGTEWQGSLEREFIVKSSIGEAIDQMFDSSVNRFMVTLGNNFLPVKKELATLGIDMMNGITDTLPVLSGLAESVMPMLRSAVEGIGNAVRDALPHIRKAVDYVANNGDTVAQWATGLVGVFALMSAAPTISGIANTILGPAAGLMSIAPGRGQRFAARVTGAVSNAGGTLRAAQLGAQMSNSLGGSSLGNTILGGILGIQNAGALNKAKTGKGMSRAVSNLMNGITAAQAGGGILSVIGNTGIGRYAGNVGRSVQNLANTGLVQDTLGIGAMAMGGLGGLFGGAPTVATAAASGGFLGRVGGALSGAAGTVSGLGAALAATPIGAAALNVGSFLGAGAGVIGAVASPLASGFLSLLGTFGPVIAGLGGVVAAVSILGDNLGSIQNIVLKIFGPQGLTVFNQFVATVTNIGNAIQNALSPEGLANIQQMITDTFGPGAGAAFGTLIPLIQTVTGIFGQIVDLGVNHLKPLILEVWEFLSGTLFPAVIPLLSTVIGLVGTTLVNAVKVIVDVVKAVTPVVEPVITGIIGLIQGIASTAVTVVNFIIRALNKLSFTVPDWVPVFGGGQFGFNLQEIALPQFAQGGIATRPSIAGEEGPETIIPHDPAKRGRAIALWLQTGSILGLNRFADGGFTNGLKAWSVSALAGLALGSTSGVAFTKGIRLLNMAAGVMELAGADSASAQKFISTARAGARLRGGLGYLASMDGLNLPDLAPRRRAETAGSGTLPTITFAPQITISGSMSEEDVNKLVELLYQKFAEFMARYERERRRTSYAY